MEPAPDQMSVPVKQVFKEGKIVQKVQKLYSEVLTLMSKVHLMWNLVY